MDNNKVLSQLPLKGLLIFGALLCFQSCQIQDYDNQQVNSLSSTSSITHTETETETETETDIITMDQPQDIEPPSISLNGSEQIIIDQFSIYEDQGVEVSDNADEQVELNIIDEINSDILGEQTITYQAIDASGNQSSITRSVIVEQRPFIFSIETFNTSDSVQIDFFTNDQFEYNYDVQWSAQTKQQNIQGHSQYYYPSGEVKEISVSGSFPNLQLVCNNYCTITILQWGSNNWQSMENFINYTYEVDVQADDVPNLKSATSFENMFIYNDYIKGDLKYWDVSNIENLSNLFEYSDYIEVDMRYWDVSSVTDMSYMFSGTESIKHNIRTWNLSNLETMEGLFLQANQCDLDVNFWDVSNVKNMSYVFGHCIKVPNIQTWDTSSVTTMKSMFSDTPNFNQDISDWNVGQVTNFFSMFHNADRFNQDISKWNVSSATDMRNMFMYASKFNQNISDWNVSNVTQMNGMFSYATDFDQSLENWDISNVTDMSGMFYGAELSTDNFDDTLISWSLKDINEGVNFDAGSSQMTPNSPASSAYDLLINAYQWDIESLF